MPNIKIDTLDGSSFEALITQPRGGQGAGIILIRGLFSQQDTLENLSQTYADLGFTVVCPDIFHRQRDQLIPFDGKEPDWEQALKLYKNFDVEAGVRDVFATLAYMRKLLEGGGKVGAVGYCLGCRLAFLMASRSDIDCTVGFYGVGLENLLDEVFDIRSPCLLHFGENDKLLPPTSRQKIMKSLSRNPAVTAHLYEGVEHGFMRESSATYNARLAALANERTHEFLYAHLKD